MNERIYLSKADVTDLEERYVLDALRSGWIAPLGPHVDLFEREIVTRVGVQHALALSSGTAALHLGLLHMGARPGVVVVLPTLTFAATANAVLYTGAEPVFVDSQASDGNVNPDLLIEAVDVLRAEGRDVVAAITVDLFGRACEYDVLEPALAERGVPLLEDSAEALGASFGGRAAGSFGEAAALSFNGNKIMTTSGGGMLLSNNEDLIHHARKLSTQAREPVPWYEHTEIGYNYRLSNILAALGRGQLERLDSMINRRREIRERYALALETVPATLLGRVGTLRKDDTDNCWLTTLTIDEGPGADAVVAEMTALGIEVRHLWKPMHMQPVFSRARVFGGGVSEELFNRGVALPSGSALTNDQVDRVTASLSRILGASS